MRLADNVYAILDLAHPIGVNAGFIITDEGVVGSQSKGYRRITAPGRPWQNACGESGNAALRRERLNQELFHWVLDARAKTGLWRQRYNRQRPRSALGYLPAP